MSTDPTEKLRSGIGAPGVRSGRSYTRAEIAAARRLGLVNGSESRDSLGGPLFWATGNYTPSKLREDAADLALVLAAIDREWLKVLPVAATEELSP